MTTRPMLILLHALGASGRSWDRVRAALGGEHDCLAPDLPGFGDRAADAMSVAATLDWLAATIAAQVPRPYWLVGHSMGGKFATLAAARGLGGDPAMAGLRGVVLLAGSPPSPEPIDEDRRAEMIGWFADGAPSEADARAFVAANTAKSLPPDLEAQAVADVRRTLPAAWTGWLTRGACEDWSDRVGRLAIPATIVAGAEDGDLGEANQRRLNLPHYLDAEVAMVADAAHLLPYERPDAVARLLAQTVARA